MDERVDLLPTLESGGLDAEQHARALGMLAASFASAGNLGPQALSGIADKFAEYILTGRANWPDVEKLPDPPVKEFDQSVGRTYFAQRRAERQRNKRERASAMGS